MSLEDLRRSPGCLSDFTLDQTVTSELDRAAVAHVRDHTAGCTACAARLAALEAVHAEALPALAFPAAAPPRRVPAQASWWRRLAMPSMGLAVAVAALLVVVRREPAPDGTRLKGNVEIQLFVSHAGRVRPVGTGEAVSPGDSLQVIYTSATPIFLAVLSRDGAGTVSSYFPEEGREAWRGNAGGDVPLPASTMLDEVLGREVIHVVSCPHSFALPPLLQQLEASSVPAMPDCQIETYTIEKRSP